MTTTEIIAIGGMVFGTASSLGISAISYLWKRDQKRTDEQIQALFAKIEGNDKEHTSFSNVLTEIRTDLKYLRLGVDRLQDKMNGEG